MAKKKKLTSSVFGYKNCPDWAQCAVVESDGTAYWCRTTEITAKGGLNWYRTQSGELATGDLACADVWRKIEDGFDASNWRRSKILRDPKAQVETPVTDSGLPDSGRRESFETGAVRDDAGDKPRPDLISPFFLERLGEHMRKGAIKYAEWNWAKGIPNSRCYASLMRHLTKFSQGLHDEDHLAAAAFNLMAIIHNEEVAKRGVKLTELNGLVDLPKFERVDDCESK